MVDTATVHVDEYSFSELKALFECSVRDLDFYHVIGREIALKNPKYLLEGLDSFSGIRMQGAIFGLSFVSGTERDEAIDKLVLILNGDAPASTLAETIDALRFLNGESAFNEVMQHRRHESHLVRASVLRLVYACQGERAEEILADYVRDPNPIVRETVVDGLETVATKRSIELLETIAKSDQSEEVKQAAKVALGNLAQPG